MPGSRCAMYTAAGPAWGRAWQREVDKARHKFTVMNTCVKPFSDQRDGVHVANNVQHVSTGSAARVA